MVENKDNSDNSIVVNFSPVYNIYGNADEKEIEKANKLGLRDLENYLQKRERDKRRKSFA